MVILTIIRFFFYLYTQSFRGILVLGNFAVFRNILCHVVSPFFTTHRIGVLILVIISIEHQARHISRLCVSSSIARGLSFHVKRNVSITMTKFFSQTAYNGSFCLLFGNIYNVSYEFIKKSHTATPLYLVKYDIYTKKLSFIWILLIQDGVILPFSMFTLLWLIV